MPVPDGSVTSAPEVPAVLNTCQTPTEGFPGSPTVATGIVSTPRFATGRTDETAAAAVVFALDDLPPKHPVAPTETATSRAPSAIRSRRTTDHLDRVRVRAVATDAESGPGDHEGQAAPAGDEALSPTCA